MATLTAFFSTRHQVGRSQEIWAAVPLFCHVGNGSFRVLSDFAVRFRGKATVFGRELPVELDLDLMDSAAAARTGPCSVILNDFCDADARYEVRGGELHIAMAGGRSAVIKRVEGGRETAVEVAGQPAVHVKQYP